MKTIKLKETRERTYCPDCCIVEWRKRYPLARVKHWWGSRVERVEEDFLYKTPENEYPKQMEDAIGNHYCGKCRRLLGWIIKPRTKTQQKSWLKTK